MTTQFAERPGLLTSVQAKAILQPYLEGLTDDFKAAWGWVQEILEQDPERRSTFDLSTQAAMVFNRFVILTSRRLEGNAKVRFKRSGRLMTINFGSGLILRFKKFDSKLRSLNVKTNAQSLIYWQMTLEGMDAATHVTFGYKTDASARNVVGVYFTCPVGWKENKWVIPVEEADDLGEPLTFATPKPSGPQTLPPGFTIDPLAPDKKSEGNE